MRRVVRDWAAAEAFRAARSRARRRSNSRMSAMAVRVMGSWVQAMSLAREMPCAQARMCDGVVAWKYS